MFAVFLTGYFLNKTRNNVFTVVAAVLVLPVAQYATWLFSLWPFKDPDPKASLAIETLTGNYNLFHSLLVPAGNNILYFDHIIVTGTKIYCIIDKLTDKANLEERFNQKIKAKGLALNTLTYIDLGKVENLAGVLKQIQINIAIEHEENLKEYTHLIAQMMM